MPKRPRSEEDGSQMKLLNWFADKQPTNSLSEKTNDGSSTTSVAASESSFQTTSKVYKFQEKWKTNRSWLLFDSDLNMMYCNVCKQYDKSQKANSFREGTSSFRKQDVDAHEQSDLHSIVKELWKNLQMRGQWKN